MFVGEASKDKRVIAGRLEHVSSRCGTTDSHLMKQSLLKKRNRFRISEELRNVANSTDPVTVMAKIRSMKNSFRP
ncbi:unnamed protein product [Gongylonema pulchrum]|uniref:Uncharacterized protein n=1 Tax=Gongylonema pulchrum TaxID=637853 RepID=A0A183DX62_9BILA|nr:unnamed protein product [Gongylonema pulchrum]